MSGSPTSASTQTGQRHQRWLPAGSVTTPPLPRDDRFGAPALRRTQHVAVTPIDRSGPISSSVSSRRTSARRARVRPGSEPRRHRPAHSTSYCTLGVRERIGQHHGRWVPPSSSNSAPHSTPADRRQRTSRRERTSASSIPGPVRSRCRRRSPTPVPKPSSRRSQTHGGQGRSDARDAAEVLLDMPA